MAVRFALTLLLAGCSAATESTSSERSGVGICGADGHVIASAGPGDVYSASDPAIQSVVISNGVVDVMLIGDSTWSFLVESRTYASVPLVIQLRDVEHRTLCSELN